MITTLRNTLCELLFRFSEWIQDRAEALADRLEDLSDRLYVPEADAEPPSPGKSKQDERPWPGPA